MQDVILGALIRFIPSLIIFIITSVWQSKRDDKLRQQLLEDQKRERKREQFLQRAKEAEIYIDQMYNASPSFSSAMANLLRSNRATALDQKVMENYVEESAIATRKQPYIFHINDPELSKDAEELLTMYQQLISRGSKVLDKLPKPESDREAVRENLLRLLGQISRKKVEMIQRLDYLTMQY